MVVRNWVCTLWEEIKNALSPAQYSRYLIECFVPTQLQQQILLLKDNSPILLKLDAKTAQQRATNQDTHPGIKPARVVVVCNGIRIKEPHVQQSQRSAVRYKVNAAEHVKSAIRD